MLPRAVALLLLAPLLGSPAAGAGEAFNEKVAFLEEFPREVARGRKLILKGSVRGAFRGPELIIIAPDGKTFLNRNNLIGEFDFTFEVRFEEGVGPYRMEIIASKDNSTKSAARFTVWYGARRPDVEEEIPPATGAPTPHSHHPRLVEKHFVARLNEFRRRLKLDGVEWNEAVASRAREHAVRMAEAERRVHGFGAIGGVLRMLEKGGAAEGEGAGPSLAWPRMTAKRPFDRPAPQPPGPRTWNHVTTFVLADESLEAMFENFFVREAAFRICAADPLCLEIGVGAARTPPPPPPKAKGGKSVVGRTPSRLVYYCVSFVQVNDETILRGQNDAFEELFTRAQRRDPELLRRLGVWGRTGKATELLRKATHDESDAAGAAALDGLLLLDEERARKEIAERLVTAQREVGRGEYREAAVRVARLIEVSYDQDVGAAAKVLLRDAERAVLLEIARLAPLPEAERLPELEKLLQACGSLPVAAQVRRALGRKG